MILWYDKKGDPIKTIEEWSKLFHDNKYKIIKQEILENGYFISTIWLGMDHGSQNGQPLIFESMVFNGDGEGDSDCERYVSESAAIIGHKLLVEKWRKKPCTNTKR